MSSEVKFSFARFFFFFVSISCLANHLNAQPQNISFECLTLDQGLSQSTVATIVQDDDGFMWFGTIDGLNKFDGYNFTVYKNNPGDSGSIADNWITSLCLGKDGTLWIGTLSRGLCNYDPRSDKFSNYRFDPSPIDSPERQRLLAELPFTFSYLNYFSIKAIFEDHAGSLWIGTFGGGLYQFDKQTGEFIHFPFIFEVKNDLAYNIMTISETVQDEVSTLWLGTYGGGLVKFKPGEGFTCYTHDPANSTSLVNNRIISICPDTSCGNQFLWIGTFGGGMDRFDLASEEFTHYRNDPMNPNSLSSNQIMTILKDCCNELWIGTLNAGLNRVEINKNQFTRYQHDAANINSLGSNEVLALFEDRTGILWIGTNFGYGINKFNRRKNKFTHYFHDPQDTRSLSENVVFSLFEDRNGVLWIGTFQTGINRFDRDRNEFTNFQHNPKNRSSISDNHVRAIFEDSRRALWIGTFSGGLNYFDRATNKFFHYKHHPDDPASISANQVRSIYEDRSGNLWIAAFGGGLDKFDRATGRFSHYKHIPDDSTSLSDNQVYFITGDGAENFWVATFGGGFCKFHIQTGRFTRYRHHPDDKNSICDDRILTIYLDRVDTNFIWLGSFGKGLDRFDKLSQTFAHFTEQDGLPNDVVYSILPDNNGTLWLSTNKGISKFDVHTKTFINYDLLDGLQSNEFNAGAYHKSQRTGEIFLGGVNGFNCFDPDDIEISNVMPPVVITSFKIFDEEMCHQLGPIFQGKAIALSHRENFFSFEFSVLDYTDVAKHQYAYKLEGLDNDWIQCGTRRYVNYTNLDPGNYIFRVKGANCDGVWNEDGTHINLKIKPRFYQTKYWHPTVVGMLILLIILFFTARTKLKIRRSLELERIRNQEKEQVQKSIAADFHDELGQKLTKISLFSEIVKTRLLNKAQDEVEYINKISKAAKELSSSTRDFIWTLNPTQNSLHDVALYLKDFGDELFDKTGIDFRVEGISSQLEGISLPMEWRRHLILIFKEAMNNVIKHSACTSMTFHVSVTENNFAMSLSDNGIGCLN